MKTIKAAIIPADPSQSIRFEDIDPELDAFQALVGGYIEVVGLRGQDMNMYLNEEGKLEGLPSNPRATALAEPGISIREDDYIAGDVVLVGPVDDNGDDTGLTDEQVSRLKRFEAGFRQAIGGNA